MYISYFLTCTLGARLRRAIICHIFLFSLSYYFQVWARNYLGFPDICKIFEISKFLLSLQEK